MPILEDVIAGIAFLVTKDDGVSPVLRLTLGKHDVEQGSPTGYHDFLIIKPLNKLGMKMTTSINMRRNAQCWDHLMQEVGILTTNYRMYLLQL
jgi:hypothetical protein